MKKLFFLFSIIIFTLLLTGCPSPPPSEKHPLLQDNAKWICDNLDMYFEVNLNDFRVGYINDKKVLYYDFTGIINKDGVMTEIIAYISGGSSINFYTNNIDDVGNHTGEHIFYGQCKLRNDILTMKVMQQREDGIIDTSIKELVFTKHDLEDETGYE